MKKLVLDAPNIGRLEKEYVGRAIESGYISTFGPYVPEFEKRFARYIDAKSAVSTQSGTAALHVALSELGIGKGDEVIVPALTFVATANPVVYVGAKPVLADVDINTWNIAPSEIERRITKKTRAIIPVHFYGNPCAMREIMALAGKHGLYVIEDATESLGARYKGRHTGTIGDMGCFSFNGNKIMTTGGGGMVVTNNKRQAEHIKFLVNQGRDASRGFYHSELGYNYRMTSLEASLGLAQLKRLTMFLAKKKRFYDIYRNELGNIEGVCFQEELSGSESSRWFTCISIERNARIESLQDKLKAKGIPSRRIFMPLAEFPMYEKQRGEPCRNAYAIYDRGLCLPSSSLNSEDQIHHACRKLKEIL